MKKQLLFGLGLCLLGFTAHAQWVNQPISFAADTAPLYLDALDANTAWTVGSGASGSYTPPQLARTVTAGQTWLVTSLPVQASQLEEVTALAASSATTAWVTTASSTGGRILRTTDGGLTWTTQSGASVYGSTASAPGLIRFFSATEGLTVGGATAAAGPLEMYATTNAGLTWTPLTGSPVALPNEVPAGTPPAVVGNHLWFVTTQGRVFHSANQGLTWTATSVAPPFNSLATVAFRDAQNGLLSVADDVGTQHVLYRTTDGGTTWAQLSYAGPLHGLGLSSVPGTNLYVSTGADVGNGDQGSSYSRDNGQTWVSLETVRNHLTTEFLSATVGWSGSFTIQATGIAGSVNRFNSTVLGTRADAALPASLSLWPNPAPGGRFTLPASRPGSAATVRVLDLTGRLVQQRSWPGTTDLLLDLSGEPAGLYVVEVQAAGGTARQKVVVE